MKRNILGLIFLSAIVASIYGCKKFLTIPSPKSEVLSSLVFSDNLGANSAIIGVFSQMVNPTSTIVGGDLSPTSFGISYYSAISADELKSFSASQDAQRFYTNTLLSNTSFVMNIWHGAYNNIYQSNNIIENLENTDQVSATVRKQIRGEALFLRAFWHFYLTNLYGDIPVVLSTDYKLNSSISRSPVSDVYSQVGKDLKASADLLNENYIGADGISSSTERIRPTKWAALALLARVYLYQKNDQSAEQTANSVINNSLYGIAKEPAQAFQKNGSEAIWQLEPFQRTTEALRFILSAAPGGSTNNAVISESMLSSFEIGDKRKAQWMGSITVGANIHYFPFKYKVAAIATPSSEYVSVLRLAEQYLIRAEARAKLNNLSGAIEDIDVIRKRAGLPLIKDINPGIQKDALLDLVLQERRVELFTEWGHRWMDLKRTGKIDEVMNLAAPGKGTTWNTNAQLFPIPQNDRNNNVNLTQNAGYN